MFDLLFQAKQHLFDHLRGHFMAKIESEISCRAVYPHDNTWSIFAMKDITVEFVHVITGATYSAIIAIYMELLVLSIALEWPF